MTYKKIASLLLFIYFIIQSITFTNAQIPARREINIPDIMGYKTLKCDLHMHTVFSDGKVWPDVRVDEAWREGIDAIAITDHIEEYPHKADIKMNHNRPHELAIDLAKELGIILIKGAEITRKEMPPGHFNALFLKDINPLDTEDWRDAIKAAVDQGAYVFWNHPGWPTGKSIWYSEHQELYEKGWIKGIEVVNEYEYYPEALEWCLQKNLAVLGNSDVHIPIHNGFDFSMDGHRPMTLIFAKEKSEEGIKEALLARRTAVYWKNMIIGDKKYLNEIFNESLKIINPNIKFDDKGNANIYVKNNSDINYELVFNTDDSEIAILKEFVIPANALCIIPIRTKSGEKPAGDTVKLSAEVKNLIISPEQGLLVNIDLSIKK